MSNALMKLLAAGAEETLPATWYIPLTFTAKTAGSTVALRASADFSADRVGIQYRRTETAPWVDYPLGKVIELAAVGSRVQFQNTCTELSTADEFVQFSLTGSVAASGNIQSLLGYATQCKECCYRQLFAGNSNPHLKTAPELPATILAERCYELMFYGSNGLTTAPELPATTLAENCYNGMFEYCQYLKTAPELPATTLAEGCYSGMFRRCFRLTTAPELPAMTLAKACYSGMFSNCESLTTAPELPATTLAEYCYSSMFHNCDSLTKITVHPTAWEPSTAFNSWVWNVPNSGTFYKPSALPLEYGTSRIPEGWTVINTDAGEVTEPPNSGGGSSSSSLTFALSGSQYNNGVLNGEYVETEDSRAARNGSFDNCTIHAVNRKSGDYTLQIQIGSSSSGAFGTGIIACYVNAPEGIVYEVSSMFGYILFAYMGGDNPLSLTLTSNDSTLNSTAAFQALKTLFLNQ